jgi:Ras-related protein Rab-5C
MVIAVAGNKCDLQESEKTVTYEKAQRFSKNYTKVFYETSAKTNEGVSELFQ